MREMVPQYPSVRVIMTQPRITTRYSEDDRENNLTAEAVVKGPNTLRNNMPIKCLNVLRATTIERGSPNCLSR
jgi:hypothetical protein